MIENNLTFTGKVTNIGERKTGNSANGAWATDTFTIEEQAEQYPQSVVLEVFSNEKNPRWKNMGIKLGEVITAHIQFGTHEYNGRVYNDIRCWRVEREGATAEPIAEQKPVQSQQTEAPFGAATTLPF